MKTITAILEPDADGTLHVPLPQELRGGKIEITATLRAAGSPKQNRASDDMLERRKAALCSLRQLGGLSDVIADPVAWHLE